MLLQKALSSGPDGQFKKNVSSANGLCAALLGPDEKQHSCGYFKTS